jgi:ferrochelatase
MTGLLLINLGTPDEPTTPAVRRYLRQFLSDPYVIDISPVGRWMLLNLIILPFRPKKSAAAYRQIWDEERGSPLLFHSRDLEREVQQRLGGRWKVALAMRYGKPSIERALRTLRDAGADRVVVLPLYPQYAMSSTVTSEQAVRDAAHDLWKRVELSFVDAFYDDEGFLDAFAEVGRPILARDRPDYVLFSFHGLPERHIRKSDETGQHCLASDDCCNRIVDANRNCYRAHCYHTARELARRLALADGEWSVSFQSRLGRTPWIRPYTDIVIPELAAAGHKKLAVFCPAFVADCLETLEEIGIRADEQFRGAGGDKVTLVPSLNSAPAWCDAVASLARRAAS